MTATEWATGALRRHEVMTGIVCAGLANGFATRIMSTVLATGWSEAVFATFDISAIVWISCAIVLKLLWTAPPEPMLRPDRVVAGLCLLAFLLPIGQASWLALTFLSLYLGATAAQGSALRRAALLLFAISLPMMWARLLISVFSGPLLNADAILVAKLVGVAAVQNTVPFLDGSGSLWIAPACSSALNVALTLLCGVAFVTGQGMNWSWRITTWTVVASLSVMVINIARLTALALYPSQYTTLHGPAGNAAFSLLILAVMVGVFWYATGRERTSGV